MSLSPKLPDIELLKEMHEFPTMFVFKAIGDFHDDFASDILNQVVFAVGSSREVEHTLRMSAAGNHASVSLKVMCHTPHDVHAVYAALLLVKGLRALF